MDYWVKELLGDLAPSARIATVKFDTKKTQIHKDAGAVNDMTVYEVVEGQVEGMILGGAALLRLEKPPRPSARRTVATRRLFDRSLLDTTVVTVPDVPLITKPALNPGDVLLFDHTQPHAFRALSDERLCRAYFLDWT